MDKILYIVGQTVPDGNTLPERWNLVGVYEEKALAEHQCIDDN